MPDTYERFIKTNRKHNPIRHYLAVSKSKVGKRVVRVKAKAAK